MQLMPPALHNLLDHWSLALAIQWHPVKIEMTQYLHGGKILPIQWHYVKIQNYTAYIAII